MDGRLALVYLIVIGAITFSYMDNDNLALVRHAFSTAFTAAHAQSAD